MATQVTTKLNNSTSDLTISAGTDYTASATLVNPLTGTTFVPGEGGYVYQSAVDYAAAPFNRNVQSGLPIAAGEWYVRAAIGSGTYDTNKYYNLTNQNAVRLTITGTPVTFTPKLASGTGNSITYKGQLGDGTGDSSTDITYTKTATTDAVTEVYWQYRNKQCANADPNYGWSSGLPKNVAISPANCGGDDTTVTSWQIRVGGFKMLSGKVDRSIYYLPTFNIFELTINKKNVTVSTVKAEKVYDGTNSVTLGDLTVNGAVDGDFPTLDGSVAQGATYQDATAGAGKTIVLSGPLKLSSSWAGNYNLTNPNLAITGTIKKADATVKLTTDKNSLVMGVTTTANLTVYALDNRTGGDQIADANPATPQLANKSTSVCSLSGTTVTALKAGDCVIQLTQASSTNYNAAKSYRDDSTNIEELIIKVYPSPKTLSVVADDIQVAEGEQIMPSYATTGLIDGDSYDNVEFDFYQGTTLLGGMPSAIGTYKVVPKAGSLTAADTGAYTNLVKYVAGKLVITAAPPVISTTSPSNGPEVGGNTVTINGTGFTAITSIKIGDITIRKPNFVVNGTGTAVTFKMPKGTGGTTITLNAGSAQAITDYTYNPPPVINKPSVIDLKLDLVVGVKFAGQRVTISGGGLKANSDYTLTMRSDPLLIYKGTADANGNFIEKVTIPAKACLAAGKHSLTLVGTAPDDKPKVATGYFTLSDGCIVGAKAVQVNSKSWTLSGFLFGYRQPTLNDGGIKSLKALAEFIKGAKTVTILGYTETDTKSAAIKKGNIALAKARCETVAAFLKKLGIKAKYKTVAKGGVDPVSLKNQSLNRRVVINATY